MTKDNLEWAKKTLRGESARQEFPQNDPPTKNDPKLPKGRKEYDDNPNHYFYDSKLFKRGSRGAYYGQDGVALTEARHLIELEDKILNKYGWESTKDIERSTASRDVFATAVAKEVNVANLHPRTIKVLDSVNKPFLVNTLSKLAQEAEIEDIDYRGDVDEEGATQDDAPFSLQGEPTIHQDYDPEHPHEHNAFDQNFGDKVAEETEDEELEKLAYSEEQDEEPKEEKEEAQEEGDRTCPECGFYSNDETELHNHKQDHTGKTDAEEDFPFEEQEDATTVTAEPDLLDNVNTDVLQVETEDYNSDEETDVKSEEAKILQQYTGYQAKAGEALGDILDGAIDTPLERQTVEETIYDRKLDGYHEDKIARELNLNFGLEYEQAVEKIRTVEVNPNDFTAKTLFGKKFADCNEAEISEMKTLGGEAKKRVTKGKKV
jgi:hypothetical protein